MTKKVDTRSLILDTAERLFGEQGLERVSIRDVITEAGVNLAAVHYHFGSKRELIEAVFQRRIVPVNQARLAALDAVERSGGKGRNQVEARLLKQFEPLAQRMNGALKKALPHLSRSDIFWRMKLTYGGLSCLTSPLCS